MPAALSPIAALVNVAVGGAFGAALRYQLGRSMTGWLAARGAGDSGQLRLLLGVGLLGGFTTFSAFSLELVLLVQRGQLAVAALYVLLSVALGVFGLFTGLVLMRAAA